MISIIIILYITIINFCIYSFIHSQHVSLVDSTTFDVFINENPIVFVNFFAPWCGHCKTIANELQEAATELQNNNEIAQIIFVDASLPINEDLAKDEEVNGYPTLTLYKNGKRIQEYLGSRKKNDFLNYIYKKSGSDTIPVSSMDEIVAHCSRIDPRGILGDGITSIVLGLFLPTTPDSGKGLYSKAAKTYFDVASRYDQSIFLLADNINLVNRYEILESSILIFTNKYGNQPDIITLSNELSDSLLTYYIISHSVPTIVNYSLEIQPFLSAIPVKVHTLLFYDENFYEDNEILFQSLSQIGNEFKGRNLFITIPSSEYQLMNFFNVNENELPRVIIADMEQQTNMRKFEFIHYIQKEFQESSQDQESGSNKDEKIEKTLYRHYTDLFTSERITSFLNNFFSNNLIRSLMSEVNTPVDPPNESDENKSLVTILIATNFKNEVMNRHVNNDIFILFYAPWCAHCKSIEPVISDVALFYENDVSTIVAKIDVSKNEIDHPHVKIRGFPTLYLFKANDKLNPIEYDGDRSTEAIVEFIDTYGMSNDKKIAREELPVQQANNNKDFTHIVEEL